MTDGSRPKAAPENQAVAAGFGSNLNNVAPDAGAIDAPERLHISWETYYYLRREVERLRIERRDRASLYREIATLTADNQTLRGEIEHLRSEHTRRHTKAVAA